MNGDIGLLVQVDAYGCVHEVIVVDGLWPGIDAAVKEAVEQWVYEPASSGGIAVPATIAVIVRWRDVSS